MTKVYIIRHAEAEGNLYRRIQGWYDSRLTDLGLKQVEALRRRFENTEIDAVYSSDKTRTRRTAAALYKDRGLPLHETPRLREIHMGVWEDMPWGNVERYDREQLSRFNSNPEQWSVEGREYFPETQKRMLGIVRELAEKHEGQAIALFTHGAAIRALMCALKGVPSNEIASIRHCDNTAVALLNVENGEIALEYMSDSSHLGELTHFGRQAWWKNNTGFDNSNLRHENMEGEEYTKLYLAARREAFEIARRPGEALQEEEWLRRAQANRRACPEALDIAFMEDEPAGVIELDTERDKEKGIGWIAFHCMFPKYRGKLLAIQLIGHAVSLYRRLGRAKLRAAVPAGNENALGYYKHFGFLEIERTGNNEVVLEKDISL